MNNQQIDEYSAKDAFYLLDYDKEGSINIEQVLNNMKKLGYEKSHPEMFDLVDTLGSGKISYEDLVKNLKEIMGQKEEDTGLQRMYDILIFNPNAEGIDYNLLKKIGDDTGNHLSDYEIRYLLNKAGDGKFISLESFIDFMKK